MTRRRPLPRLHVVTNKAVLARQDFVAVAQSLLLAGEDRLALHVRMPGDSGRRLYDMAERLVASADESGALLMVNDRVDVALAAGAGGAQVGARGLPLEDARRLLGRVRWLGASVHDVDEARHAAAAGVDFVLAGTLYATPSHPGRSPAGTGWLANLGSGCPPAVGIGGVSLERVPEVLAAGAAGVAVIRAIWDAEHPQVEVLRFIDALY